uniref:Phlebovirus glycoprotein G2 fusion domain-containing protein n=1 Tax=Panagrellus redivivus TaxID=6233 RepID=A0A7E4V861_PANRE
MVLITMTHNGAKRRQSPTINVATLYTQNCTTGNRSDVKVNVCDGVVKVNVVNQTSCSLTATKERNLYNMANLKASRHSPDSVMRRSIQFTDAF